MMDSAPRTARIASRTASRFLTSAALVALAACSGGGSVNLGSGQSADPATVDFPVAYVKRSVPTTQDDLRQMRDAVPDADLYVRDRASPSAVERNVTDRVTGTDRYDVRDVDVDFEGRRFVFSMRGPLAMNQDEEDPPTWQIWEYDVRTDELRRVIASDTVAVEGNDVAPHYLPDGRIVFSSTRQRQGQAILRDEGKPGFEAQNEVGRNEPSFVLHVMDADGTDLHQVSFNQSHDLDPTVLSGGRLLWSRWEGASNRGIHLYTANPDGTDLQLHYGARSHATGTDGQDVQFVRAREMPDGRILALLRPMTGTDFGGDLAIIDANTYVENTQPVHASAGLQGPAQQRATRNDVRTIPGPSPGGRFHDGYPLWDGTGRILVTWSQCRLLEGTTIVPCTADRLAGNPVPGPPLYSAFLFDPDDNTLRPLFEPVEGVMVTDLVAAQPRPLPRVILDKVPILDFDPALQADGVGILDIRSVYDFDGLDGAAPDAPNIATLANPALRTADQRRARFLRVEKAVSIPDDDVLDFDNSAFGASAFMREILGYVPIEPDGSVRVQVPANVAFRISVLDRDGRRLFPAHRNWLQLRPGETRRCNGCHTANTNPERSHGRDGLFPAAWAGAPSTGVPFPGTVAKFSPDAGETMAQTRARWSCANETCRSMRLSVDVAYSDEWTDAPSAGRAPDQPFAYAYAALSTPLPVAASCTTTWNSTCRIVVNYPTHIHPLWSTPRPLFAGDGVTLLEDRTCTRCHSTRDAANAPRVPAGQLDLSDGPSDEVATQLRAYRELLFPDNAQEVNMGAVTDIQVTTIDPATGQPTTNAVNVGASLAAGNARGSTRFYSRFVATGDHAGFLTPAELRLISEWVDIGAQYFNNPFDPAVPLD